MTRKIIISKKILNNLYIKQKLSTHKIAKQIGCNPSVIQKRLKELMINIRNPKKKIKIPRQELFNLYINKKLSTQRISQLIGISSCTVYHKLKELNIQPRSKKIIKISEAKLKELYYDKKFPLSKIAKLYNCNASTILNKMKIYKLKRRDLFESKIIYPKEKFTGNKEMKAYMIGFRLGDLHIKSMNKNSTIFMKSNTTKEDQYDLIKEIYGIYGHCKFKIIRGVYHIWCNLDKSFYFLVPKEDKIENWILNNNKFFFAFLGGYIDAEGNISVSQGRARLRIRSYDKNILFQIYDKLNFLGINTKFSLINKKGIRHNKKYNKDCWGVFVNSKEALFKLFEFLKPFIKHKKRYNDLTMAEKNILERNKKNKVKI